MSDIVEKQLKKNIQEEPSGLDKNPTKDNSLDRKTEVATPENHVEATASRDEDLVPGASGDRPTGADVYSSEEDCGSPRLVTPIYIAFPNLGFSIYVIVFFVYLRTSSPVFTE